MNIGVVFSPGAGKENLFSDISAGLRNFFDRSCFYTPKGAHGSNYFPEAYEVCYDVCERYVENLNKLLEALFAQNIELLITVGGDGIATYCANYMIEYNPTLTIMGISSGTTNIGPIARVKLSDLIDKRKITKKSISAIKVMENGKTICYSFHDVIIGNTILGTVDSKMHTLSAEAMINEGKKLPLNPSANIINEQFSCYLNSTLQSGHIKPAQIVVSSIKELIFLGQAIHGIFCFHQSVDKLGAMVFVDKPLVRPQISGSEIAAFTNVSQMLFGTEDIITLEGFSEDAYLIADGNPYKKLSSEISFKYIEKAINISFIE